MCGIFGFTFESHDPLALLWRMGDLQVHRGPDDSGYYYDDTVAMGMRRLSIIDLEGGAQPFYNSNDTVIVICNGEIYNYVELREELKKKGCHFKTNSDVEVLPHLYDEYGPEFVQKLNGMFAIALYDKSRKEVFLVRDRLGIKPLYYALVDGNLMFSSELKSILAANCVSKEIRFDAISTYLELLYIPAPLTPFSDVLKLESGTYLKWKDGRCSIVEYWNPSLVDNSVQDEETAKAHIISLLEASIRLELRSDVPIGSFLSGGIDSSTVTAFAAMCTEKVFRTFHIDWGNTAGKFDESKEAKTVADRYGTRHFVKRVSDEDLINHLPKLIWHLDEPFADGAFVFTYAIAKQAAKNVKVILCGAGGDELFGGYHRYKRSPLWKFIISRLLHNSNINDSYFDKRKLPHPWKKYFEWFEPAIFAEKMNEIYKLNKSKDVLNAIMLSDIKWYLQDDILFLTDKMTMAASVECRVPLLDYRLVEFSLSIASELKIRNGEMKYIFKKVMEQYLPKTVIYRPKEGFGAPIRLWVNNYKSKLFDTVIREGYMVRERLISRRSVLRLIDKEELNDRDAWQYWIILILEIWMQLYVEERSYETIF